MVERSKRHEDVCFLKILFEESGILSVEEACAALSIPRLEASKCFEAIISSDGGVAKLNTLEGSLLNCESPLVENLSSKTAIGMLESNRIVEVFSGGLRSG